MIAIVVHGGAGPRHEQDNAQLHRAGCLAAARVGYELLQRGRGALDAVEASVVALEDNPLFNAGNGSVLNADGDVEMDALVMDGRSRRAGGVTCLRGFANPVRIARSVMEGSPHVLLSGEGAARHARAQGFPPCPPAALVTPRALERWHAERDALGRSGTVGAVAVDAHGNVAAATSTGGLSGKLPGRVGDTPIIGAGTYADIKSAAASATGQGEPIMRVVMCKLACDAVGRGLGVQASAELAVRELSEVGGEGGIILVSPTGELGMAFSSARMSRAWITEHDEGSGFGREPE